MLAQIALCAAARKIFITNYELYINYNRKAQNFLSHVLCKVSVNVF